MNSTTTLTPSSAGRTLLIHGYSASAAALEPWRAFLVAAGIPTSTINIGNYITLNNEVTLKDLGEAFDRALRLTAWSSPAGGDSWTFDAVVHSTGILVLRQWLAGDPFLGTKDPRSRIKRLKHLVGLAPATFGSPQAKQGRSWLGALIKGNRHFGPDFLNAGDQVLDGLELGSRYTWELSHKDLVCTTPLYDKGPDTPYVAVFIGNQGYDFPTSLANPPGADGTVRWAGCSLNTRKVSVDFRRDPKLNNPAGQRCRCSISPWTFNRQGAPMIAVDGKNHGTIVSDPDPQVADLMIRFFKVVDEENYNAWEKDALDFGNTGLPKMKETSKDGGNGGAGWQQLLVHVVDDHGDSVTDYNLQLFIGNALAQSDDPTFPPLPLIVDTYSGDGSYRCFYVRLSEDMLAINTPTGQQKKLWLELIASSGSSFIEYEAYTDGGDSKPERLTIDHQMGKPVKMDITPLAQGDQRLLYPYTTTLLEIFVEREPLPLDKVSQLFAFL